MDTLSILSTRSLLRTHEAEAVVQRATRTTRVRSGVSGYSFPTSMDAHWKTHFGTRDGVAAALVRPVHHCDAGATLLSWPHQSGVCTGAGGRDDNACGEPDGEDVEVYGRKHVFSESRAVQGAVDPTDELKAGI